MAYSDFNLKKDQQNFGLQIDEQIALFAEVHPLPPSPTLVKALEETAPLALAINTMALSPAERSGSSSCSSVLWLLLN
jgi:hypothetical protein